MPFIFYNGAFTRPLFQKSRAHDENTPPVHFFLPHLRNSYSSHPNDFEDNRIIDNQNGAKSGEYWGEGGIESYLNCSSFWNGAENYLDWNNPFCLETKDGCCSSSSADFSQSSCSRQFFIVWFGFKMEWREGFFGI